MADRPVVLLTGAGRAAGIAHGIARELAARGWDLALATLPAADGGSDRQGGAGTVDELDALLPELHGAGARAERFEADLADPDAPDRLADAALAAFGRLDGLVLSHAVSVDSAILDTTVEAFDRHLAVNARAAWLLIRAFARAHEDRAASAGGRIVALTSDHVIHNMPYGASKGALDRIVRAAAGELADRGITANLVNPGPVDTGWMDDATRAALTARQPTGRLGTPDDAARIVAFLLSEDARWITGQLIMSDGGFSL